MDGSFPMLQSVAALNGLARDAFERGTGGGVELAGHASSEIRLTAGKDGVLHGFGHENGIGGSGDGGVHEDAVGAHLHREGGIGGGADSGIDDEGNGGDPFTQDLEGGAVLNAEAGTDGGGEGHDSGGACVNEALGEDDVVGGVGEDGEAFADEGTGGFEGGLDIRVEGGLVADDFDLDPV